MDALQNLTDPNQPTGTKPLDQRQLEYIDFCAINGLVTAEDGSLKQMSVGELAMKLNVHRQTFYDWRQSIPDFWGLVATRRKELAKLRNGLVWKGVMLRAAKGDAKQAEMWLSHFDDYKPPAQKWEGEVTVKGFVELVQVAATQGIIEGEFSDAGASGQNLPPRAE